jgi:hypothetical protein
LRRSPLFLHAILGRAQCLRKIKTNRPGGRPYNEAFSHWLNNPIKKNKNGGKRTVTFATLDDGIRSRLD